MKMIRLIMTLVILALLTSVLTVNEQIRPVYEVSIWSAFKNGWVQKPPPDGEVVVTDTDINKMLETGAIVLLITGLIISFKLKKRYEPR